MTDKELFDAIANFNGTFRLSNKAGQGYWWCYLTPEYADDDTVVQANSPREAIQEALNKVVRDNKNATI